MGAIVEKRQNYSTTDPVNIKVSFELSVLSYLHYCTSDFPVSMLCQKVRWESKKPQLSVLPEAAAGIQPLSAVKRCWKRLGV